LVTSVLSIQKPSILTLCLGNSSAMACLLADPIINDPAGIHRIPFGAPAGAVLVCGSAIVAGGFQTANRAGIFDEQQSGALVFFTGGPFKTVTAAAGLRLFPHAQISVSDSINPIVLFNLSVMCSLLFPGCGKR
jgi:hypothetical protein